MKKLFWAALSAAVVSCTAPREGTLVWGGDTIFKSVEPDYVLMTYPVAEGTAAAGRINGTIAGVLKQGLPGDADREEFSLSQALDTMMARKREDTLLNRFPYDVRSSGDVFTRGAVASVSLKRYLFTGGAHGMTDCSLLNFDTRDGRVLERGELFTDTLKLEELNRAAFRNYMEYRGMEDGMSALIVDPEALPLPANIGFDSAGVVMLYNQYEVAPYSFGVLLYRLPYADVAGILTRITEENN